MLLFCLGTPVAQADNKPFTIVLDAGHGGKDPGTIGSAPSHREKDIALNITLEVGKLLRNNHPEIKVIYTRQTDVFVELGRRAEIANQAKADLFVSIHVNSLPKTAPRHAYGVQSYTLSLSTADTNLEVEKRENSVIALEGEAAKKYNYNATSESNIMFEIMQDRDMKESVEFAKMAQNEMVKTGGRKDMGVKQANLAVLRKTYMPSVLLEVGYISTPAEENFLMSNSGQSTMARSIYNAISGYKAKHKGTSPKPIEQTPAVQNTDTKVEKTAEDQSRQAEESPQQQPLYRVQILAGAERLKANDRQFKGLKVDVQKEGNIYKYTYGAVTTMQEAKALLKTVLDKFPQAFIVHY